MFKKKLFIFLLLFLELQIITSKPADTKLSLQLSTAHFDFYSLETDVKCLNDLAEVIEKNYDRICSDLNTVFKKKIKINIYSDVRTYHIAVNRPNDPDWSIGSGGLNEIWMTSPLNPGPSHSYSSLMQTIVHEFVHVATWNITGKSGSVQKWLSEGIAYYEANQFNDKMQQIVKLKVKENNIPSLTRLATKDSNEFSSISGYQFSCSLIEYIIKTFGMKSIIDLIKTDGDIENSLKISKDELEDKWIKFLKVNYK